MRGVALGLALSILAACQGPASSGTPGEGRHVFVIAALMAGHPEAELGAEQVEAASRGHFANMKRLSEQGRLLLAGPSGVAGGDFRGLFVLDTASLEEAREWVASDPAVAAGLLQPELTTFSTSTDLSRVPALVEAARVERLAADPEHPSDGFEGRTYVLATTNRGTEAGRLLGSMAREGRVLFRGDLGPPAPEGTALFVLDLDSLEAAERRLEEAGAWRGLGADWALDLWWATEELVGLP